MPEFITIVMPALNEEAHIETSIRSILPEAVPFEVELLVVDGGSTDKTRMIAEALMTVDPRIKLLHNPARLQSAAINMAARRSHPDTRILIRADCHSAYPRDFLENVTRPLLDGRASSVVVPMKTEGTGLLQSAIAVAQNSKLGNGGASHRHRGISGYVDHGHHAAFLKSAFIEIGGYRTDMRTNEDAELDLRLIAAGHKIWLCREAEIIYRPRDRFIDLARQYFRYGQGRAKTWLLHRQNLKWRQVLPVLICLIVAVSLLGSVFHPLFFVVTLLYLALCQIYAVGLAMSERQPSALLSGLAAAIMHVSWGAGFISFFAENYLRPSRSGSSIDISHKR